MRELTSVDTVRKNGNGCSVVLFSGQWCGPCKIVSPMIERLESELGGKVSFFKVDVGKCHQVASDMTVSSIPTVSIWKNGREVKRLVGSISEKETRKAIEVA